VASLIALSRPTLRRLLPGLAFGLLVVGVFADPLFFRRNFAGRDLAGYNLPMEKAMHDAYARSHLPVWMPEISGGRPLLPNPNAGSMYPVRPVLSVLPFPMAMRLFPILHWIVAGIGMIVLTRLLGTSRAASWVAAVTYVFSGVGVGEVFFPHVHPGVALLPWIVWAVARPVSGVAGRILPLSLLFSLVFLAGDVFTGAIAVLASLIWIFVHAEGVGRIREVGLLLTSLLLATLLALPQVLATILWIPETNRAVVGMKLEESLFYSISPFRLLELLVPFPFGSTWTLENARVWGWSVFHSRPIGLYPTLYAGAFAVVALVVTRKSTVAGARFAKILLVTGLVLSVTPSLLPHRWHYLPSPLPLRYPEKFAVAVTFAIAVLTAIAFDRIRSSEIRLRWTIIVSAGLAAASVIALLFPSIVGRAAVALVGGPSVLTSVAARTLPENLVEGGLLWAVTVPALALLRKAGRRALAASVSLLTVVPIASNRRIALTFPEEEIFSRTAFVRTLDKRDPRGSWRTIAESLYRPDSRIEASVSESDPTYTEFPRRNFEEYTQMLWKRGTVFNRDFDRGDFVRMEILRQVSSLASRHSRGSAFFGSLALRWGIRFRDQRPLPGYRRFGGDVLQDWDEHEAPLPAIRLVERWKTTAGGIPALKQIGLLDPGEILIETGRLDGSGAARGGEIRIVRNDPERLVVETRAPAPTWLFVLRGYWNYRSVRLDGKPVETYPAQIAFSAVAVPAGFHSIDWRELVPGGEASFWGPVIYVLVAAFFAIRRRGLR
jgi:hypothetical protein